jgi:hypothetical protein
MSARFLPIPRQRREPRANRHDDPARLDWLRSLPCHICAMLRRRQFGRTEAAHVGQRGLGQKCSDLEAIPLCACHHRTGEFAHHRMGKRFWLFWNLERGEVIRYYQERYRGFCALLERGHAEVA